MPPAALAAFTAVPPFSSLDGASLSSVVARFEPVRVAEGEVVIEEGDDGACMYFIAQGRFRVHRRADDGATRTLAEMGEGEFFGEMSLLSGAPRFATVEALGPGELLRLHRRDLDVVVATHPDVGRALERFYKERLVANVARASRLFHLIVEGHRDALVQVVRVETHPAGALLLVQGDPAKGFFLLLRGSCEVFHRSAEGREIAYPTMHEGDVFGELSLLQDGAITASVRARTRAVVLAMGRQWFDEMLLSSQSVRSEIYALAGDRSQRTRELIVREELEKRLI
ncbi:MAG TPA: cyclic nucleotide-binding domain-containing protein [Polyangiaceae bacterium]